jgi:hypothetical protein
MIAVTVFALQGPRITARAFFAPDLCKAYNSLSEVT